MTETKRRKDESVEDLDAKIAEMEAELHDTAGRPLSWEEVTSTTAEDLARKEQRRGVLPRLIEAAKVKRLEVELRDREREAETLRGALQGATTPSGPKRTSSGVPRRPATRRTANGCCTSPPSTARTSGRGVPGWPWTS